MSTATPLQDKYAVTLKSLKRVPSGDIVVSSSILDVAPVVAKNESDRWDHSNKEILDLVNELVRPSELDIFEHSFLHASNFDPKIWDNKENMALLDATFACNVSIRWGDIPGTINKIKIKIKQDKVYLALSFETPSLVEEWLENSNRHSIVRTH